MDKHGKYHDYYQIKLSLYQDIFGSLQKPKENVKTLNDVYSKNFPGKQNVYSILAFIYRMNVAF